MRWGDIDGKGTIYQDISTPILTEHEKLISKEELLFHIIDKEKYIDSRWGYIYLTNKRIIGLRTPDPWEIAKTYKAPKGEKKAIDKLYESMALFLNDILQYFVIEKREIIKFKSLYIANLVELTIQDSSSNHEILLYLGPRKKADNFLSPNFINNDFFRQSKLLNDI